MEREIMEYDVVVVGGVPADLATVIRFAQLNQENNTNFSICLLNFVIKIIRKKFEKFCSWCKILQ